MQQTSWMDSNQGHCDYMDGDFEAPENLASTLK